ncbi:unnamed protein product [Pieris macdunnoughi]|uniref:Uncharacterized protein n=1 Tax=Pieris macdunnoughi TaxID=345717 RepID=A0A821QD40_9NEOP|nr:unnamed protein product [Pieris macdunnoughi]
MGDDRRQKVLTSICRYMSRRRQRRSDTNGGVGRCARASQAGGRLGRIFRGAGGRGRAGGRRAERGQPQQRHTPPPEHGGQRAGRVPYAARGLLATKIRTPWRRAAHSPLATSARHIERWDATRERARGHTATAATGPTASDRTRTLFRERRSAPPPPARPPWAANFTRNCGRAVRRYVPRASAATACLRSS